MDNSLNETTSPLRCLRQESTVVRNAVVGHQHFKNCLPFGNRHETDSPFTNSHHKIKFAPLE